MICNECNTKNGKNDKFCRNCGKSLEDVSVGTAESILKTFLEHVKGVFLKPVDTAKNFIKEENYFTSLIYMSVNVLVLSLIVLILAKSYTGMFAEIFNVGFYDSFYTNIELPYFRIFLISIMTGLITYALLAGFSYLISAYLFKSKTSFKKMCAWLGFNSVFYTVVLVVVVVSTLISVKFGLILYLVGELLYTYNMIKTFEFSTDTDANKLGYVLVPAILLTLLVVVIVLPKVLF